MHLIHRICYRGKTVEREVVALKDFETFLLQLGTLPENKIKFSIHRVRRFFKSCNYEAPGAQRGVSQQ